MCVQYLLRQACWKHICACAQMCCVVVSRKGKDVQLLQKKYIFGIDVTKIYVYTGVQISVVIKYDGEKNVFDNY